MITYSSYSLPLKALVTAMGQAGLPVYKPNRLRIRQELTNETAEMQHMLDKAAGYHIKVGSKTVNHFIFNDLGLKRPKSYGEKDTVNTATLLTLDASYDMEVLRLISALRTNYKILSTYLSDSKFINMGNNWERFPCDYNISTDTLRLSSREAHNGFGGNYQNFPKRKGAHIRDIVKAPHGHVILAMDLSKAEVWTTGIEANSQTILDTLKKGIDIHKFNGDKIYSGLPRELQAKLDTLSQERERDMARELGKKFAHGIDYGMGINKMVESCQLDLGIPLTIPHATAIKESYLSEVPEIPAWHESVRLQLYTAGYLTNRYGFYRRCHNALPKFGQRTKDHIFFTYYAWGPQSTVAIYTNLMLIRCHELGLRAGKEMIAQVHDELIFIVKHEAVKETIEKIQQAGSVPIPSTDIVIPQDFSIGDEWGSLEELAMS